MIECLNNLVGIRTDCGEQVISDSGLYLQDLPFINLKTADSIVTTQDSGYALLQQKLNFAQNYMVNDIRSRMMPYFKVHSVVENEIAGYTRDNMAVIAAEANLKGIQLKIVEYPYLSVYLSSISLFTQVTGDIPVFIYDLSQSKLLDTITVSAVANEITSMDIHKEYQTNGQILNLFICYDASEIGSYNTTVFNPGYNGYVGCRGCSRRRDTYNGYTYCYSKEMALNTQVIERNLSGSSDTGGLSITYSVSCSLDKWICQNRNGFAMALLHRAGMEILKEFAISNRINSLVTLRKDEAAKLEVVFQEEYDKSMDNVLKNLRLPNDLCFKCEKRIQTKTISV